MPLIKEFKAFAMKGNVIDLAVAVVIGAAFTKIIKAIVDAIIMPLVGKAMGDGDWEAYEMGGIKIGVVLGAVLEFLIVAFILFLVVVKFMGALKKKEVAPPASKTCAECLESIPIEARRCKACTSPQAA